MRPQSEPLKQVYALLPKITNDELLTVIACAQMEAACRVENYADVVMDGAGEASADVVNEGIALAVRLDDMFHLPFEDGNRKHAHRAFRSAFDDLKAWSSC